MKNRNPRRRQQPKGNEMVIILAVLFAVMSIAMIAALFPTAKTGTETPDSTNSSTEAILSSSTPVSDILATCSVGVTGDILPHGPVIRAAQAASGTSGQYDFSDMFTYIAPYFQSFDYMVANFEANLGGTAAGEYMGWPTFNCPDSMVDALLEAGVDMMLTANNHSYDTGSNGFLRTQQIMREKGMAHLGTVENESDKTYTVVDLNGIKVGMVCYTYNTGVDSQGCTQLNGQHTMTSSDSKLISTFNTSILSEFYSEIKTVLAAMKDEGAEATIVYMHWGDEYELVPDENQTAIAQALCDLGVDVIVGGHPHVIQPFDTLTSENGHTTYCLYSTGNALSNQRTDTLTDEPNKEYTEDGLVFGVEFEKLKDGTVQVSKITILPTWVDKQTTDGTDTYAIIPLDSSVSSWNNFGVADETLLAESYDRTMGLVGEGLNEARKALGLSSVPVTYTAIE